MKISLKLDTSVMHVCPAACIKAIKEFYAQDNIEVHATIQPPLVVAPAQATVFCPHGRMVFVEPTGDELARWAAERDT